MDTVNIQIALDPINDGAVFVENRFKNERGRSPDYRNQRKKKRTSVLRRPSVF